MKKRIYTQPAQVAAPHKGVFEQMTDGIKAIPGGIKDFLYRTQQMLLNPETGAKIEFGTVSDWKRVALNFIGVLFELFICLTISLIINSFAAPNLPQTVPAALAPIVSLVLTLQVAPSLLLIILLTAAIVHLMASLLGSKAPFEKITSAVALLWAAVIPLTWVVGIFTSLLRVPSITIAGKPFYGIGDLVMDLYVIYALARILPITYSISTGKALFMAVIYQLILRVLFFVAITNAPALTA